MYYTKPSWLRTVQCEKGFVDWLDDGRVEEAYFVEPRCHPEEEGDTLRVQLLRQEADALEKLQSLQEDASIKECHYFALNKSRPFGFSLNMFEHRHCQKQETV